MSRVEPPSTVSARGSIRKVAEGTARDSDGTVSSELAVPSSPRVSVGFAVGWDRRDSYLSKR